MASVETAPDAPTAPYWTLADYECAIEAGVFGDRRIELIGGQLYEMPSMKEPHIWATRFLTDVFIEELGRGRVSCQMPIILPRDGQPEPDIAVAEAGAPAKPRPEHVQLVIEVTHETRGFDRGLKLEAYLADGLHEVWIVDLVERCVLVYRAGLLVGRHVEGSGAKLRAERVPEVTVDLDELFRASLRG